MSDPSKAHRTSRKAASSARKAASSPRKAPLPAGKAPNNKEDRLFNPTGRRAHRKRYSLAEVRAGVVIVVLLLAIGAWVAWRGLHPDPSLFEVPEELLAGGSTPAARGPLPEQLALDGWSESAVSQFDKTNLYEKIDGREDYYKSFGFERLYFLSITQDVNQAMVVDIELFDLATAANALGAYAGERPTDVSPDVGDAGMSHIARNALFMTRGRYYLRAIGADESEAVVAQLRHLRQRFEAALEGEPLPWAYALFVGSMGFDPGRISYMSENAFSFGFARDVYAALLDDEITEIFVCAAPSEAEATSLAAQFKRGFLDYGAPAGAAGESDWIRDRYRGRLSGARATGIWVLGVHAAAGPDEAAAAAQDLEAALQALPPQVVEAARRATPPPKASGDDATSGDAGETEAYPPDL